MNSTTKLISTFKNKHLLNKLIKKSYLCSQNKIGVNQNNICKKSPELVSLDQRLLNYISSLQRSSPSHNLIPNDAIDPRSLKNSEIPLYINNLQNQNKGTSFLLTLQEIDQECCRRLVQNDFTRSQILLVLNSFVATAPYYARSLKFYPQALKKVGFFIKILTIPEIVELCFYTGFLKKSDDSKRILGYALRKLNNKKILRALSLDDIVILVSAAFKTGTRIVQNDGINNEIKVRLCNELSILQDESYFIALVKSMRHNFNYDEEILSTLAYAMFFNKTIEKCNFTALAHIVTLYADALYFDSKLFENFTLFGLKHLRNFKDLNLKNHLPENFSQKDHFSKKARLKDHFSKNLRLKDLSRFLFSLSYIGFENLKNEDFALISDLVKSFVNLGFLENGIEDFLSILLSFAMLEHFDEQLIGAVLKEKLIVKGKFGLYFVCWFFSTSYVINLLQKSFYKMYFTIRSTPSFHSSTCHRLRVL